MSDSSAQASTLPYATQPPNLRQLRRTAAWGAAVAILCAAFSVIKALAYGLLAFQARQTGAQAGAFQIAGTDSVLQLPFFVTACDYTLMGEELYAASAYLSREPILLGSLKAQDYGKLIALLILVGFTILAFLGVDLLSLLVVS